ncbi:MAG: hypothetical protein LAT67_15410 [Balneolales bacterium]|nr:hypothetical protein [Balneolales bacterium]
MTFTLLLLFPFMLSDQLFNRVTNAVHIENDVYLITTMGGEYHAHIFDATKDVIIKSFVRNGGGPEEARGIKQMAPCNDASFVFLSKDGKILHYDKEFKLIQEHQTIYSASHSLHCADGIATIGSMSFYNSDQLHTDEEFTISVSINLENGEKVSDVIMKGSDIYLGPDIRFDNLPLVYVNFFIAKAGPENYLIAIGGSPVLYLTGEQLITIKYDEEFLAKTGHEANKNEQFGVYGQRGGGVNLSWQYFASEEGTTYRFDFGRADAEIPFGYIDVQLNNEILTVDSNLHNESFQEELAGLERTYVMVRGESTRLLFQEFDYSSNYLYIAENKEN